MNEFVTASKSRTVTAHEIFNSINHITNAELDAVEIRKVTEYLKNKLLNIPRGSSAATEYHRTIVGIMELLFYPSLASPKIEEEIHDGRKRMDIVFDNCADFGFFIDYQHHMMFHQDLLLSSVRIIAGILKIQN